MYRPFPESTVLMGCGLTAHSPGQSFTLDFRFLSWLLSFLSTLLFMPAHAPHNTLGTSYSLLLSPTVRPVHPTIYSIYPAIYPYVPQNPATQKSFPQASTFHCLKLLSTFLSGWHMCRCLQKAFFILLRKPALPFFSRLFCHLSRISSAALTLAFARVLLLLLFCFLGYCELFEERNSVRLTFM